MDNTTQWRKFEESFWHCATTVPYTEVKKNPSWSLKLTPFLYFSNYKLLTKYIVWYHILQYTFVFVGSKDVEKRRLFPIEALNYNLFNFKLGLILLITVFHRFYNVYFSSFSFMAPTSNDMCKNVMPDINPALLWAVGAAFCDQYLTSYLQTNELSE